ncbi:MAG: response regulator [Actinobacteria bacterium]|nr:response regulator [Actinomycetota bacterium]
MARILYAEDDPAISAMVEFRLSEDGHHVTCVLDGGDARRLLAEHTYDIVLLDVMMPGADGFALCRELAARPDRPRILMISARVAEADVQAGLDAGADGYVTKPFNPNDLAARIAALSATSDGAPER